MTATASIMKNKKTFYFGCKCVFEHRNPPSIVRKGFRFYEEQIFIVKAASDRDARKKARKIINKQNSKDVVFSGLLVTYMMWDDCIEDGSEVFASFRESKFGPKEYIKRHFKSVHDFETR